MPVRQPVPDTITMQPNGRIKLNQKILGVGVQERHNGTRESEREGGERERGREKETERERERESYRLPLLGMESLCRAAVTPFT